MRYSVLLLSLLLLGGCSAVKEEVAEVIPQEPTISALIYSPKEAVQFQGLLDYVRVDGIVDFEDMQGDVTRLEIVTLSGTVTIPLDTQEKKHGSISFYVNVSTKEIKKTYFFVQVVDVKGNVSNRLGGVFEVK